MTVLVNVYNATSGGTLFGEVHYLLSTALLHKLMILQVKTVIKIQQIIDPMKTIN